MLFVGWRKFPIMFWLNFFNVRIKFVESQSEFAPLD